MEIWDRTRPRHWGVMHFYCPRSSRAGLFSLWRDCTLLPNIGCGDNNPTLLKRMEKWVICRRRSQEEAQLWWIYFHLLWHPKKLPLAGAFEWSQFRKILPRSLWGSNPGARWQRGRFWPDFSQRLLVPSAKRSPDSLNTSDTWILILILNTISSVRADIGWPSLDESLSKDYFHNNFGLVRLSRQSHACPGQTCHDSDQKAPCCCFLFLKVFILCLFLNFCTLRALKYCTLSVKRL